MGLLKLEFTREQVERWRDRVHRRTHSRAISSRAQALRFINDVGFCFAFASENSELPSLWHAVCGSRSPAYPEHSHSDPAISFVWELKDELPAARSVFYGRLLRRRPTFVSLEYLPHFYVLSGRTGEKGEYLQQAMRGRLSQAGREIMDTLTEDWPQSTKILRRSSGLDGRNDRSEFDRAMIELQEGMFIAKVREERVPFSFVWSPFRNSFPGISRRTRRLTADTARVCILERYFRNQLIASVPSIHRLFRWEKQAIFRSLGRLVEAGTITANVRVTGEPQRHYCLVE
jgi:hypothetical protein